MLRRAAWFACMLLGGIAVAAAQTPTITTKPPGGNTDVWIAKAGVPLSIHLTAKEPGVSWLKIDKKEDLPKHGDLIQTLPSLTYKAKADYSGPDEFQYTVKFPHAASVSTGTIRIEVQPAAPGVKNAAPPAVTQKPAPIANDQSVVVDFGKPKVITLTATGDGTLTFDATSPTEEGATVTKVPGHPGQYTYKPRPGQSGSDSFTFTASNGTGNGAKSAPATVQITIERAPEPEGDDNAPPATAATTSQTGAVVNPAPTTDLAAKTPASPAQPWWQGLIPLLSASALALVAILWAVITLFQVRSLRRKLQAERNAVNRDLRTMELTLQELERTPVLAPTGRGSSFSQQQTTPMTPKEYPMATVIGPRKPGDFQSWETGKPQDTPRNEAQPTRPPQDDPVTTQRFSSEPEPTRPAPAPVPQSPRWQKTPDLTADYNLARVLGADAPQLFMSSYRCQGLSCVNLNDRRANPSAELRFDEATRGVFMGIDHGNQMLLVPSFDRDLEGARNSLEGVFDYNCNLDEATTLKVPATVRRGNSGGWVLQDNGVIGRG